MCLRRCTPLRVGCTGFTGLSVAVLHTHTDGAVRQHFNGQSRPRETFGCGTSVWSPFARVCGRHSSGLGLPPSSSFFLPGSSIKFLFSVYWELRYEVLRRKKNLFFSEMHPHFFPIVGGGDVPSLEIFLPRNGKPGPARRQGSGKP